MDERKSVGILMIVIFIFAFAYRALEQSLSENYLDLFVIAFFMVLIFAWQYISPKKTQKEE
jgi:ABC-type uncharacterized transport system permease subunit